MNARSKVEAAARSRLALGEPLLSGGFVWIAFPRPRVSLAVLARHPHLIGITDRRVLIWARRHAFRAEEDPKLVVDLTFGQLKLDGVRTFSPMLQVRACTDADRELVLEFRPRNRRLGHRLVRALDADASTPGTEVATATS